AALQPALPVVTVRRYYLSVTSSSPHRNLHQRLISKTHRGLLPFHRFNAILASTSTCASIAWRNTDKSNDSLGECASYQDLQRRLIEYWCQDSFRLDLQRKESSRLNRFPWPQIPKHLSKLVSLVSLHHWRHPLRMVCPLHQDKS